MKKIRIGAGAGYAGDRIEPARELAERGDLDYLCFECLAERTVALAQKERLADARRGFAPRLAERMEAVLAPCRERGIRIVTNMGAANPMAALEAVVAIARRRGLNGLKVAAVTGDDVLDAIAALPGGVDRLRAATGARFEDILSANAYMGIEGIMEALAGGADVVITGRVSDPALFVAPLAHEFGWALDDWHRLGRATLVGHLLECAGQLTGGYFADPGYKDVPQLARLGFPLAEVAEDGSAIVTKTAGSGGRITVATCKEQLLYELHDPGSYLQPYVEADFSEVRFIELAPDRIAVEGGSGRQRPDQLKASVGYFDGFIGEGQMSYAGPGAVARARLALDVVAERLDIIGLHPLEIRYELIGVNAIHRVQDEPHPEPSEVRLRVAGRTRTFLEAQRIGEEVETLYTNGPAGGGGAYQSARQVIAISSILVPRDIARYAVTYEVV